MSLSPPTPSGTANGVAEAAKVLELEAALRSGRGWHKNAHQRVVGGVIHLRQTLGGRQVVGQQARLEPP